MKNSANKSEFVTVIMFLLSGEVHNFWSSDYDVLLKIPILTLKCLQRRIPALQPDRPWPVSTKPKSLENGRRILLRFWSSSFKLTSKKMCNTSSLEKINYSIGKLLFLLQNIINICVQINMNDYEATIQIGKNKPFC